MFSKGQKVVCINNKPISNNIFNDCLKKLQEGRMYTIIGTESTGLQLKEVKSNHILGGFDKSRFRSIDDMWVEELLCKLKSEVETDFLMEGSCNLLMQESGLI